MKLSERTEKTSGFTADDQLHLVSGGASWRVALKNLVAAGLGLPQQASVFAPVILCAKNIAVLTEGAPADIGTMQIPAGIARWVLALDPTDEVIVGAWALAESAEGALDSALFEFRTEAGGGGGAISAVTQAPASAGQTVFIGFGSAPVNTLMEASTIHIRQTENSLNAGALSFYLTIYPSP